MTRSRFRGAEVGGGECLSSCEGCPVTEFMTPQWNIKREGGGFMSSWTRNIRPRHRAKKWTESFSAWKSRYRCRNGHIMPRLHTSAHSAMKCFRVLSLEHLKLAVACHATPWGGFQRTGKYRNIERDQDEAETAGQRTCLPRKCQSRDAIFFYLTPSKMTGSLEVNLWAPM